MIIGVVGKSGAGKNKVAEYLESIGFNHYDFDKYAHRALNANSLKIAAVFGKELVHHGRVNRKALGDVVFSNPKKLKALEKILWKWINIEVGKDLKGYAVLNAALLHISPLVDKCDLIFWVQAPYLTRVKRLLKRDDRNIIQIIKRLNNQKHIYKGQYKGAITLRNTNEKRLYKKIDNILWAYRDYQYFGYRDVNHEL